MKPIKPIKKAKDRNGKAISAQGNPSELIGFQLWQAANRWQRLMRLTLAPLDLTHVQYLLLAGLAELDAMADETAVNQNQIAGHLGMDKMMASKVIRALADRQLLARKASDQDARAIIVWLMPEGQAIIEAANNVVAEADAQFFEVVGKKEDKFLKYLRLIIAASQTEED